MIRIIKNNSKKLRGVCGICGSIFSYKAKDLKFKKHDQYIFENGYDMHKVWKFPYCLKCPCCRKWIQQSTNNPEYFICVKELN